MKTEECLQFVGEILSVLKTSNQHEKVFSLIVDRVVRVYGCQTCAVIIVDPSSEYLRIVNCHGLSHTFVKEFHRKITTGVIGRLLWTGAPVLIPDTSLQEVTADEVKLERPFGSCLCVQITVDHRTLGYLHADSATAGTFTERDIPTLQGFADFAAIALNKSRLYEENLRLDTVDHETELKKYPSFLEKLDEAFSRSELTGEEFALFLLDIDNYKHIALTYGYESAKTTLREIADIVRLSLRPMDTAGRYGFDELIILRCGVNASDASQYAERLRHDVAEQSYCGKGIRSSVSIGGTMATSHGPDERRLLLAVKESLYEAQRSGRNRVVFARTINQTSTTDATLHG